MTRQPEPPAFDEERLGGHTIEELSDYLDRGRTPRDPAIENSPECRLALAALERLRSASHQIIETEAETTPPVSESWIATIISNISREVKAGRDIPIEHPKPAITLSQTEGAVRALIRAAGDSVPGAVVGRCRLDGDVTDPGSGVTISVSVTAIRPRPLPALADEVRQAIATAVGRHTELVVEGIDVTINDVQFPPAEESRS